MALDAVPLQAHAATAGASVRGSISAAHASSSVVGLVAASRGGGGAGAAATRLQHAASFGSLPLPARVAGTGPSGDDDGAGGGLQHSVAAGGIVLGVAGGGDGVLESSRSAADHGSPDGFAANAAFLGAFSPAVVGAPSQAAGGGRPPPVITSLAASGPPAIHGIVDSSTTPTARASAGSPGLSGTLPAVHVALPHRAPAHFAALVSSPVPGSAVPLPTSRPVSSLPLASAAGSHAYTPADQYGMTTGGGGNPFVGFGAAGGHPPVSSSAVPRAPPVYGSIISLGKQPHLEALGVAVAPQSHYPTAVSAGGASHALSPRASSGAFGGAAKGMISSAPATAASGSGGSGSAGVGDMSSAAQWGLNDWDWMDHGDPSWFDLGAPGSAAP